MRKDLPELSLNGMLADITQRFLSRSKPAALYLGPPGIGKTSMCRSMCKKLTEMLGEEIGFVAINLSVYTEVDFPGAPAVVDGRTRRMPMTLLPCLADGAPKRGILLLDEVMDITKGVEDALKQLLDSSRSLGNDYHLPDGWLVVCTGNLPEDTDDCTLLRPALIGRVSLFKLNFSSDEWIQWARTARYESSEGVDEGPMFEAEVISYLSSHKEHVYTYYEDGSLYKDNRGSYACPRSWQAVSEFIHDTKNRTMNTVMSSSTGISRIISETLNAKDMPNKGYNDDVLPNGAFVPISDYSTSRIESTIGSNVATSFIATLQLLNDIPDIDEILEGKCEKKCRLEIADYSTTSAIQRAYSDYLQVLPKYEECKAEAGVTENVGALTPENEAAKEKICKVAISKYTTSYKNLYNVADAPGELFTKLKNVMKYARFISDELALGVIFLIPEITAADPSLSSEFYKDPEALELGNIQIGG